MRRAWPRGSPGEPVDSPGGTPLNERRTEARNPRARDLATMTTRQLLELMNDEDASVAGAVRVAIGAIERAVNAIDAAVRAGAGVVYSGAGTSGRLGVLDASEMPPTFGVPPDLFRAVIAGGDRALREAIEGAEDDPAAGRRDAAAALRKGDVLVGISASGRAPYVIGALEAGEGVASATVAITCDPGSPLARSATIAIVVDVGREIVAGSSRLKAGTATKLVLNMLSTAAMVRSGRTRGDLMADLRPTNDKLRTRAVGIVRAETGVDEAEARRRLERAGWDVRKAMK